MPVLGRLPIDDNFWKVSGGVDSTLWPTTTSIEPLRINPSTGRLLVNATTDVAQTEDAAHSSGATGAFVLVVRNDAATALAANGDYIPLTTNSAGALYTTFSGTVTVDSEMPAAAALADNTANPTTTSVGTFPHWFDGVTWDRARGDSADGLLVNLGTNNDVTVTGTVTIDSELPAAAALSDNFANPTAPAAGAFGMVWDGATWDRMKGDSTDGALVNLGSNNDVTVTGTVMVDSELPAAGALADATANPTTPLAGAANEVFNGTTWDRMRGSTTGTQVIGGFAHDAANTSANNPQVMGLEAIAHGTNPTAVAAADVTKWYANRAGIPFVIGGHPNTLTKQLNVTDADGAQTDTALVTVGAGAKIVVTHVTATADNANTGDVQCRIGFGTANTPANDAAGIILSHPGIAKGSGVSVGNGSGIIGIGADNEDLRLTCEDPAGGSLDVVVGYFTIES